MSPPPVLLTGFEPFGGDPSNPSWTVAARLDGLAVGSHAIVSRGLPVDGARAVPLLLDLLESLSPAAVVMLGLTGDRPQLSLERVAVNVADYRIPDNAGLRRADAPLAPDGPAAYFTTLPTRAILESWRAAGIPGYLSDSAGTFLCNEVFYAARHHLATAGRGAVPAGFVHLPCDEALALGRPRPYVPLEHQVAAVRLALEVVIGAAPEP